MQGNYSEFSEEIVIKKEEIPFETEYSYNITCQEEKLYTDWESFYGNCSEDEYYKRSSGVCDGNDSSKLLIIKQEGTRILQTGEKNSELGEWEVLKVEATKIL